MTLLRWLAAAVLVGLWVALSRAQVLRAQRVWRGEKVPFLPMSTGRGPEVNRRNYAAYSAFVVLFTGAALLLVVGELLVGGAGLQQDTVFKVALVSIGLAALSLMPMMSFISTFNRPRWMVPPSLRGSTGTWARSRERRARRRAALPETEHEVEILDVRPAPGDPKPFAPYYVAVCGSEECDWMSDIVDHTDGADGESTVRHLAASHSSRVVGPRRPVG